MHVSIAETFEVRAQSQRMPRSPEAEGAVNQPGKQNVVLMGLLQEWAQVEIQEPVTPTPERQRLCFEFMNRGYCRRMQVLYLCGFMSVEI